MVIICAAVKPLEVKSKAIVISFLPLFQSMLNLTTGWTRGVFEDAFGSVHTSECRTALVDRARSNRLSYDSHFATGADLGTRNY